MTASITFDDDDYSISSISFSVDYDQTCLGFDGTDSVTLTIPAAFIPFVSFVNGEIRFVLFAQGVTMPDGVFADITFTVSEAQDCRGATAEVGFSSAPAFGDSFGTPVTGWSQDGSVKIADE